ncbi:MAG: hypothetical protein EA365_05675 [Gloeocapsa sp. DLM2.Bin57]|nr:MAG: hypothetical protein EA365_05675 [Gloeocapsa sp. DLM2.Bin57]
MGKSLKLVPWLLALPLAWLIGYSYNVIYGGGISWLRIMYQNKLELASEIDSQRRVIIIGGSGVHYTINAEQIEQELGIPVFNLGLDGKLGLNVLLPSVLPAIREGDIVVLIPEYLMLSDSDGLGEISSWFGVATGKPGLGDIPPKQLLQDTWLLGIPSLRALTKSGIDLITKGQLEEYYSDPLTNRGDPTKTWERSSQWWKLTVNEPISPHSIAMINSFQQQVEAKGATLLLSLSWIYGSTDPQTVKNIQITAKELEAIAPLLYNRESLNIKTDSSLFADTHYHLKPEGRKLRSQELAQQLQPYVR